MAANYNESEKVKRLAEDMALHEAKNPGEWSGGTYGKGMDEALQKVLNRDKFQYDINGDALYQQYKDRYIQQGKQAMMDTIGQASALTGGYGNSYAQGVGQLSGDVVAAAAGLTGHGDDEFFHFVLLLTRPDRPCGPGRQRPGRRRGPPWKWCRSPARRPGR